MEKTKHTNGYWFWLVYLCLAVLVFAVGISLSLAGVIEDTTTIVRVIVITPLAFFFGLYQLRKRRKDA